VKLPPESAAVASQTRTISCDGDVLAWESSVNKVNVSDICCHLSHVVDDRDVRPVAAQHALRLRVDLAVGHRRDARTVEAEVHAASTGE
jgi:hypothetical protein